jgi:hypothetical protein
MQTCDNTKHAALLIETWEPFIQLAGLFCNIPELGDIVCAVYCLWQSSFNCSELYSWLYTIGNVLLLNCIVYPSVVSIKICLGTSLSCVFLCIMNFIVLCIFFYVLWTSMLCILQCIGSFCVLRSWCIVYFIV